MDPLFHALSKLRRRKFDECIEICTELLERRPLDQAVWFVKTRALTQKDWIDDTDMEEEGAAEILLDEHSTAQLPRPGTSLQKPNPGTSGGKAPNPGVRPMTGSRRPLTGFARPGTNSGRPPTSSGDVSAAFKGGRPGTSRPVTSAGRFVRLGTASLRSDPNGPFISVERLNLRKYAERPALGKALFEYIFYCEHNMKKGLELAALGTVAADYKDWWWKEKLGKCYYQLGLLRDAEKQFRSALSTQNMVSTYMNLAKVHIRMDQPNAALELYKRGTESHPGDIHLLLGVARINDQLNNMDAGVEFYKKVLSIDSSNVEAIACLAANYFYDDQPEMSLRLYRRLLLMGLNNAELWNNFGLSCFYASQYDMALSCFHRSLSLSSDDTLADVWYNVAQVAIAMGDLSMAYQALKVALSHDNDHAESFNNLGVLELRKGNHDEAKSCFETATRLASHLHEPFFNAALLAIRVGDFQEGTKLVDKALEAYPAHAESLELKKQLKQQVTTL